MMMDTNTIIVEWITNNGECLYVLNTAFMSIGQEWPPILTTGGKQWRFISNEIMPAHYENHYAGRASYAIIKHNEGLISCDDRVMELQRVRGN